MLELKKILPEIGKNQRELAEYLKLSQGTVAQIVNHGLFPKTPDEKTVRAGILRFLEEHGASLEVCRRAFDAVQIPNTPHFEKGGQGGDLKEEVMLLRKQTLTPDTLDHFKIDDDRNPFVHDILSNADVFLSRDIRNVRQALLNTAKHGGLLAVIGESGSGKSTLRCDLNDRIKKEKLKIIVIEPSVFGMEQNDIRGKTLKVASIAEAIITAIAPGKAIKRSTEARDKQVVDVLRASAESGASHILVIEEAHAIPTPTLKHLKRISEITEGYKKLLGIALFGQTELRDRLSENDREVREVVQRCSIVTLPPLGNELDTYIKFKFDRVKLDYRNIIDESGIAMLRHKLDGKEPAKGMLYPLAVINLLTAAMNLAAEKGFPKVDSDVIKATVEDR